MLELLQVAPRRPDHRRRHAGEPRHLQAVAVARRAFLDRVQEHDAVLVLDGVEVHVGDLAVLLRELGQLEVVGGEQREGARCARRRWRAIAQASARPSKVEVPRPISSISTRLASVALCRMLAALGHLDHEGRAAAGEVVGGADAGEDAVDRADARGARPARSSRTCASSTISATWRM